MIARSPRFFLLFISLCLKFLFSHLKTAFVGVFLIFLNFFLVHLASWSRRLLSLDSKHFRNKKRYFCCRDHYSAMLCRGVSCTSTIFWDPASCRGDLDLMLKTIAWISFEHRSVCTSASDWESILACEKHLYKHNYSFIWFSCLFPPHSASHSGYL